VDERAKRIGENEALYRSINEKDPGGPAELARKTDPRA